MNSSFKFARSIKSLFKLCWHTCCLYWVGKRLTTPTLWSPPYLPQLWPPGPIGQSFNGHWNLEQHMGKGLQMLQNTTLLSKHHFLILDGYHWGWGYDSKIRDTLSMTRMMRMTPNDSYDSLSANMVIMTVSNAVQLLDWCQGPVFWSCSWQKSLRSKLSLLRKHCYILAV